MDVRQSVDQALSGLRPFFYVVGLLIMLLGLVMFFFNFQTGFQMFSHPGLEVAFAGFLTKSI